MVSLVPDPPSGEWHAPGTGASARLEALSSGLEGVLDGLAELPLTALSDEQVAGLVHQLTAATGRLTHALARTVADAERRAIHHQSGHRSAAAWYADATRVTLREARRLVKFGLELGYDANAPVADALSSGQIRADQAAVILRAVDTLPDTVDTEVREQARDRLLADAAHFDADALRRLGKGILDIVAPEIGESHEQKILAKEAAAAAQGASLTMYDDGHGRTHGTFTIPAHQGAMLRQAIHAIANPQRHDHETLKDPTTGDWRSVPERHGAAFGELIERYPVDQLPSTGGVNAQIVITMTLDTLTTGTGVATLDNGDHIDAGTARRLACEAGIIPAVLGGPSEVLDLGRTRRYHSKAQRIALGIRDRGCTARGCTIPPSGCHAHHDRQWARDRGSTNIRDCRLYCPHHHRRAHDPAYQTVIHADNTVTFHRRR
ncbi:HNH endonuclease [Nocardioides rotundus]|uniref:HNH endonuclease signature motif containing protein n=1 Tax=Nocardioides rotundus TaxID=1774216 RepID=UPI001CBBD204|nr:HNH endonuclease signature motif containing protein [Nocardioides rotundus]UAL31120.1 HNH endonuclease [Nocardioides rotundus]